MYVKIFESIMTSSLAEDFQTRHIFMDLLVLADPEGLVDKTPESISRITNVPLPLLQNAIRKLCLPDPQSRSRSDDGRRLRPLDPERKWGWQIVNFRQYRQMRDENARRAYMRGYMRDRRAKERARKQDVIGKPTVSPSSKQKHKQYTKTKTERENRLLSLAFGRTPSKPQTDSLRPVLDRCKNIPEVYLVRALENRGAKAPWKALESALDEWGHMCGEDRKKWGLADKEEDER